MVSESGEQVQDKLHRVLQKAWAYSRCAQEQKNQRPVPSCQASSKVPKALTTQGARGLQQPWTPGQPNSHPEPGDHRLK